MSKVAILPIIQIEHFAHYYIVSNFIDMVTLKQKQMPDIVAELTQLETRIKTLVQGTYGVDEICVYLLSKKLQCIHKFNDTFIDKWHSKYFEQNENKITDKRKSLILYFSNTIVGEQQYEPYLEFWIRKLQFDIIEDMKHFHSCSSCSFIN